MFSLWRLLDSPRRDQPKVWYRLIEDKPETLLRQYEPSFAAEGIPESEILILPQHINPNEEPVQ
jgi:hypothetical protein